MFGSIDLTAPMARSVSSIASTSLARSGDIDADCKSDSLSGMMAVGFGVVVCAPATVWAGVGAGAVLVRVGLALEWGPLFGAGNGSVGTLNAPQAGSNSGGLAGVFGSVRLPSSSSKKRLS